MYVAVKGGDAAIEQSWRLLAAARRGDPALPELSLGQIREQLRLAVDRVMTEGSLYDRELAALALKQAAGDTVEAIFLLRAYRTTLPRLGTSEALDTGAMRVRRRISSTFKDLPGGQVLGPTTDYTQRLLDFALAAGDAPLAPPLQAGSMPSALPRVASLLREEALLEPMPGESAAHRPGVPQEPGGAERADAQAAPDLTRAPLAFPAPRALRLQALARADEGFLLALGYSTQRGYANTHPFAGEIRMGEVGVQFLAPELGFAIDLGEITLTECQMINQFTGGSGGQPPCFTQGYGLAFGEAERKAMAMALVDRSLRAGELGEQCVAPAQDEEFVLLHADNVEASGFVQHLKLPHHVDFQAELELLRQLRAGAAGDGGTPAAAPGTT